MDSAEAWDCHGNPLVSNPTIEHAIDAGLLPAFLRPCPDEATKQRKPAWLDFSVLAPWVADRTGPFRLAAYSGVFKPRLDEILGIDDQTYVWAHQRQLYVLGPRAGALAPWIAPHVPINGNHVASVFREDVRVRNPFRSSEYETLVRDAKRAGIDLSAALDALRKEISAEPATSKVLPFEPRREELARSWLRELASREWHFRSDGLGSTIPLWLSRAASVPLLLLEPGPYAELHVIASMGAGRILSLRAARFPASAAAPMEAAATTTYGKSSREIDGGDVHVSLRTGYDQMLEAESLAPRRRVDQVSPDDDD